MTIITLLLDGISKISCMKIFITQNEQFWRDCGENGDLAAVKEAIRSGEVDLNWRKEGSPFHVRCISNVYPSLLVTLL